MSNFINEKILLNVSRITKDALPSCNITFIKLLYGNDSLELATNNLILNTSIDFTLPSKRFNGRLFKNLLVRLYFVKLYLITLYYHFY